MKYVEALEEWDCNGVSLFLGGGISSCSNWQKVMIEMLSDTDLVILNPRRENFPMHDPSASSIQIKWEHAHLAKATSVLFWFASETLCPITLFELGTFAKSSVPLFVGTHLGYERKNDVKIQMGLYRPEIRVVDGLELLAQEVKNWNASYRRWSLTEAERMGWPDKIEGRECG